MAGKCRKGWQLPRPPRLTQPMSPVSPTPFYTFFMYQELREAAVLEEAQPTPHTAPVGSCLGQSRALTYDGLGRISDLPAPPSVQQEGLWVRSRYSRRAVFMRDESMMLPVPLTSPRSPLKCNAALLPVLPDWRCQPGVAAPLPVASRARPPAGLAFS